MGWCPNAMSLDLHLPVELNDWFSAEWAERDIADDLTVGGVGWARCAQHAEAPAAGLSRAHRGFIVPEWT